MKFQSKLKNTVASALIAGMLMLSSPVKAGNAISGWGQIIGGAAGGALSWIMTEFFTMIAVNVDPIQLAAEGLVYAAMLEVTDKWEPEPQESYEKAAQNNDDGSQTSLATVTEEGALPFEVQSLKNVGIEVLNLKDVASLAQGRAMVAEGISVMVSDGSDINFDLNDAQLDTVNSNQSKNYQWMSTAGLARAELGLKTAFQAAGDAGGEVQSASGQTGNGNSENDVELAASEGFVKNQSLTELPSAVTSTAGAMRVQTLMNMELAQRVNLSNALQGSILSIEAARALKNAGSYRSRK